MRNEKVKFVRHRFKKEEHMIEEIKKYEQENGEITIEDEESAE